MVIFIDFILYFIYFIFIFILFYCVCSVVAMCDLAHDVETITANSIRQYVLKYESLIF